MIAMAGVALLDEWAPNWVDVATPREPSVRVLVVEDDYCLQTVLTRLLKKIDRRIEVDWAMTAEEATALIQAQAKVNDDSYRLVIADIRLPGKVSGIDLWHAFNGRYPETAFLLTSSMPVEEVLKRMEPHEICPPFLAKPFYPAECKRMIRDLLRESPC